MNKSVLLAVVALPLWAAQVPPTQAGKGTFEWRDTTLKAKGTESSLKVEFKGTAVNKTGQPWAWAKFCVKAYAQDGSPIRPASSECLIDLTASRVAVDGSVNWKYTPKLSLSPAKRQIESTRFEITFVDGSQDAFNVTKFGASCDTVWPHALQAFVAAQFSPKSTDRAGGVMSLDYQGGAHITIVGLRDVIRQHTTAAAGPFNPWEGFRIDNATAIYAPVSDGCRAEIVIHYALLTRTGWVVAESNGLLERRILEDIAARMK